VYVALKNLPYKVTSGKMLTAKKTKVRNPKPETVGRFQDHMTAKHWMADQCDAHSRRGKRAGGPKTATLGLEPQLRP